MDSVSDRALRSGPARRSRLRDGDAPGAARLERLGLEYQAVSMPGISEDVAMLLAYEKGAELIVAVGTHFNLIEFLERTAPACRRRSSLGCAWARSSSTRRACRGSSRGSRAPAVRPVRVAGLAAIVVAIAASPALRHLVELFALELRGLGF